MPFNWGELVRNNPEPDSGGWEPFRYYLPPGAVAGPPRPGTPHPLDTPEMQNLANGALQMMQSDPITAAQSAPAAPASPPVFSMRGGMPGFNPSAIVNSNTVQGFLATGIPGGRSSPQERWTPPGPNTTMVPGGGRAIPPEEANAAPPVLSPRVAGGTVGAAASPRTGWWASRPEFNTGPSVLDIWNGLSGTGYDANMRQTTPNSSLPTFTPASPDMHTSPTGTPQLQLADQLMQRYRNNMPGTIGSPEWNQALSAGNQSIYGRGLGDILNNQVGQGQLGLQQAQAFGIPSQNGQPAIQGSIANAAQLANATPSAAQSAYVRQRQEILDRAEREGLTPEQVQNRLRFHGYGPVLPGGPELSSSPPVTTLSDMLSSAVHSLRPLDPRNGAPIASAPPVPFAQNRQRFFDTITNLMQSIPDQEMNQAAIERVRSSVTPIAFQSWLEANPGWDIPGIGLSPVNALHRAQRDRVRNLLSRPQIINNGLPR